MGSIERGDQEKEEYGWLGLSSTSKHHMQDEKMKKNKKEKISPATLSLSHSLVEMRKLLELRVIKR